MADISTCLKKILSAIYGKDVRQAIHDAIYRCYLDGKAGAIDLEAREDIAKMKNAGGISEYNGLMLNAEGHILCASFDDVTTIVKEAVESMEVDTARSYVIYIDDQRAYGTGKLNVYRTVDETMHGHACGAHLFVDDGGYWCTDGYMTDSPDGEGSWEFNEWRSPLRDLEQKSLGVINRSEYYGSLSDIDALIIQTLPGMSEGSVKALSLLFAVDEYDGVSKLTIHRGSLGHATVELLSSDGYRLLNYGRNNNGVWTLTGWEWENPPIGRYDTEFRTTEQAGNHAVYVKRYSKAMSGTVGSSVIIADNTLGGVEIVDFSVIFKHSNGGCYPCPAYDTDGTLMAVASASVDTDELSITLTPRNGEAANFSAEVTIKYTK